ncbi:MAG: SDR family oxidoreductase [Candidatus Competibacteraceae bacterium]|nr:SDR family oxidoreductase [Candidatus Competibacteraceae bacterium]
MKMILITGATDGIGRETARQLLAQGHWVLLHGRTQKRAQQTIDALNATTAVPVWGDLAAMCQVQVLADQVRQHTPVLDVLLHNAGVYEHTRCLTADGFERTMAVNYFSPFLLTQRLLDLVKISPQGRIVTVSSIAHQSGRLDLEDLTFARHFDGYAAYGASKLANILFTQTLAQRLAGTAVTANCLHPGVIDTKLLRSGFGIDGAPVADGARTSVYLATAAAVSTLTGQYFIDAQPATPSAAARDERLAEALWQVSITALQPFLKP